jgi:hypothetical protein
MLVMVMLAGAQQDDLLLPQQLITIQIIAFFPC